jgi:hypothetical protein
MSEFVEVESDVVSVEEVKSDVLPEIIDLENFQTNGKIAAKAYWYAVKVDDSNIFNLTVLASGSTAARDGIRQQFPNAVVAFLGFSEKLMQVNG